MPSNLQSFSAPPVLPSAGVDWMKDRSSRWGDAAAAAGTIREHAAAADKADAEVQASVSQWFSFDRFFGLSFADFKEGLRHSAIDVGVYGVAGLVALVGVILLALAIANR